MESYEIRYEGKVVVRGYDMEDAHEAFYNEEYYKDNPPTIIEMERVDDYEF